MRIQKNRRRGYTLIELLVVLAIIAVLISLSAAAVLKFRAAGPRSATRTNLGKIRASIGNQWKAVADKARNDPMSAAANATYYSRAQALGTGPGVRDAYVNLRLAQAFPRNFAEVFWPDVSFGGVTWRPGTPSPSAPNAWQAYVEYLRPLGIRSDNESAWTSVPLDVQTAICLLMILEKGPSNTGVTRDDLGLSAWKLLKLTPVAGDMPGIIDGWLRPVRFSWSVSTDATITIISAGDDGVFGNNDDLSSANP